MKSFIATWVLFFLLFQPAEQGVSQSPIIKAKDNTALKDNADVMGDSLIKKLNNIKKQTDDGLVKKYKTIYRTKYKTVYDTVTVMLTDSSLLNNDYSPDPEPLPIHDTITIHDTVKTKSFIHRFFHRKK